MNIYSRSIGGAGLLAVAIGLAACNSDRGDTSTERVAQSAETGHEHNREHGSYKKPGADVGIKYQLPEKIRPGQTVDLEIAFNSPLEKGELEVKIKPEGLEILSGQASTRFTLDGSGKYTVPLSVYCAEGGRAYLNLFVTRTSVQGNVSRQVSSIPFQVGDAVANKVTDNSVEQDSEGNPVRTMPAEETISEDDD